jgi:hypothetical protein
MLDTKGLTWTTSGGLFQVKNGDVTILRGHKHQNKHKNLYVLKGTTVVGEVHATMSRGEMTIIWHSRLRHMSSKYIDMLSEKKMLSKIGKNDFDFCEHCVMGKQMRKPFGVGTHSSKEFLEYVHSDVCEPFSVASLSSKWYYVSFIDDYSRFIWVYFLRRNLRSLRLLKVGESE